MDNLSKEAKDVLDTVNPVGKPLDDSLVDNLVKKEGSLKGMGISTADVKAIVVGNRGVVNGPGVPVKRIPTPLGALETHKKLEHEREMVLLNELADKNLDAYLRQIGASADKSAAIADEFGRLFDRPIVDEKIKRDDESMQEYSDRMDRLQRAKQKCQNCPHERGHHLFGDCGMGDCNCEKFVKREYERPAHLMDRPFKDHEGLEALKEKLDKTVPVSKKQNPRNSRANHPAGRGRNKKESN